MNLNNIYTFFNHDASSYQFVSYLLQFFLNFLRVAIEVLTYLHLLIVGELVEDLTKLAVHYCLTRRVVRPESLMVSTSQSRNQVFHVELKMSEKIDIFSSFKGTESIDATVDSRVYEYL